MNIFRKFSVLLMISTINFYQVFSSPNCKQLSSSNSFGRSKSGLFFSHLTDSLNEITIYYTSSGISGLSFGLKNGENMSYMENYSFTEYEKIDLRNVHLIGVDIWVSSIGINGLKFQVYDALTGKNNATSEFGSTAFCHFYLNSTFMKSKYLKINQFISTFPLHL